MNYTQTIRLASSSALLEIKIEQLHSGAALASLFDSRAPNAIEVVRAGNLESALVGCCKLIPSENTGEACHIAIYPDEGMLTNELILSVLSRYMMWSRDVRYV